MLPPRTRASLLSVTVCLSLVAPQRVLAGPPDGSSESPSKVEPPAPTLSPGAGQPDPTASSEPVGPSAAPEPSEPPPPGIEFAVPPPEDEEPGDPDAPAAMAPAPGSYQLPDPGMAPSDGVSMLVLSGTTLGLTVVGVTAGLIIGLERGVDLEWLLPATIVPAVGLLAFAGGGMYLGITRARAHRRWEIGYRVIGLPQGGGAMIGGSFMLLTALGLIPSGAVMLDQQPEWGAALIAVGSAAAIASPVMFVVGARNQRRYQQTGGWKRKPLPPMPPTPAGPATSRLELRPLILPAPGGVSVGAGGRF
jgi:hypothetical protein